MKSLSLVVVALLVPVDLVRGDAGPNFLRPDERFPAMRFENLAEYPDFDFYLMYEYGRGNPHGSSHNIRVLPGEVLRLSMQNGRKGEARLTAVRNGKSRSPVGPKPAGVKQTPLVSTPLDGIWRGEEYLVPYRVEITNDNLLVGMQPAEIQPVEMTISWLKGLTCIAVPVAFCVALGWLGIRMARRLFPPKGNASASPMSNTR